MINHLNSKGPGEGESAWAPAFAIWLYSADQLRNATAETPNRRVGFNEPTGDLFDGSNRYAAGVVYIACLTSCLSDQVAERATDLGPINQPLFLHA